MSLWDNVKKFAQPYSDDDYDDYDEDEEYEHHHDEDGEHAHHHHHHEDGECCCHHHDEDGEHPHHHYHDEEDHAHHHHEDGACCCHHHHGEDEHHHHHHADEVFTSWGVETAKKFEASAIASALNALDSGEYGIILRAKGILPAADGTWIHFDFVPEEHNVRTGGADVTGKLCVIGSKLDESAIAKLFGV